MAPFQITRIPRRTTHLLLMLLLLQSLSPSTITTTTAFVVVHRPRALDKRHLGVALQSSSNNDDTNSWSITDDWSQLSSRENGPTSSDHIWQQDIVGRAAFQMETASASWGNNGTTVGFAATEDQEEEEHWRMQQALEQIHHYPSSFLEDDDNSRRPLDATTTTEPDPMASSSQIPSSFDEEIMSQEIAQLIRCNEDPMQLLIDQGRAVAPLTVQQKYNVRQLVQVVVENAVEEDSGDSDSSSTASPKRSGTSRSSDAVRYEATAFLKDTVEAIFLQHAIPQRHLSKEQQQQQQDSAVAEEAKSHDGMIMDSSGVASWYQTCLDIAPSRCGPHDARIQQIISRFGTYGKGWLTYDNLLALYLQAILGRLPVAKNVVVEHEDTWYDILTLQRRTEIDQVWRDFERHNIESPNTIAWKQQVELLEQQVAAAAAELEDVGGASSSSSSSSFFHDECEIVEHGQDAQRKGEHWIQDPTTGTWQRTGKSSHERVEVCKTDPTVAARIADGEFVYIDEESCIGCTQCVVTAPSNFCMLEQNGGRARTFYQDNTPDVAAAVATCPVNCMHYVGFERLIELERARDDESVLQQKNDHFRHFGPRQQQGRSQSSQQNEGQAGRETGSSTANGNTGAVGSTGASSSSSSSSSASQWIAHTPLYVSRMQSSDANHKESIYHYFRNQCYKSSACPQKGCYDCPMYASNPESNPHWQRKKARQTHVRAQHFLETGAADGFRNKADL